MHREFRERFPRHRRIAIPTCIIPCGGCVFCKTQLNPSTAFTSSVTGKQFTWSSNEIPRNNACTTKNVKYLITCDKCCMQYAGMTTTNIRTRFANDQSCIENHKRNILLYDHFCGPGHEISDCKSQIIFHLETDDNDARDVLLVKEEYVMRMLSTLYPFGLNDNVNSLNINIKTCDFIQFNCLNSPFFSYAQPRKKRSHGHRKNSSQTALDFNDFISKINNLYTAREHHTLYTLMRSVSHQYLKIPYIISPLHATVYV